MTTTVLPTSSIAQLAAEFDAPSGYLAVPSNGIMPRRAVSAMVADLQRCGRGEASPADYDPVVADTRAAFAALVGVPVEWVATGSVTSALLANVAAGLPDGSEVLVGETEFNSVVLPFAVSGRLRVRTVPLADLASAIGPETAAVAFSLVQSATGVVIDAEAIQVAARRHGALTVVDLTQAAGVLPVRADEFDVTVTHTYKWLCTPRGVAFLTIRPEALNRLVPVSAGWYSADRPWTNLYWPDQADELTTRSFDTAPAWQAFVGARESIRLFAHADADAVWAHARALGDLFCREWGIPEQHRAIVSLPDADHALLARLTAAGVRASGPLGLLRLGFHVWNTESDVELALAALR